MKKYLIAVIIVLCLSLILAGTIYKTSAVTIQDMKNNPNSYIPSTGDNRGAIKIGNIIVWIVRIVGEAIAVIMLMIIGIKYVLGSVEEKAEYKKTMWPYVLGAVLIFSGAAVTNIIYEAFQ